MGIVNWILRLVTKNKAAVILSPQEVHLALISEQNGTPLVDWKNVFVRDKYGNLYSGSSFGSVK